jgi:hypothetical protein
VNENEGEREVGSKEKGKIIIALSTTIARMNN